MPVKVYNPRPSGVHPLLVVAAAVMAGVLGAQIWLWANPGTQTATSQVTSAAAGSAAEVVAGTNAATYKDGEKFVELASKVEALKTTISSSIEGVGTYMVGSQVDTTASVDAVQSDITAVEGCSHYFGYDNAIAKYREAADSCVAWLQSMQQGIDAETYNSLANDTRLKYQEAQNAWIAAMQAAGIEVTFDADGQTYHYQTRTYN